MRCRACDNLLTDFESSVRGNISGEYIDLCARCISPIRAVLNTSENFLLFDNEVDDLDTQFTRVNELAYAELLVEDDSALGVNADGERIVDVGGRHET